MSAYLKLSFLLLYLIFLFVKIVSSQIPTNESLSSNSINLTNETFSDNSTTLTNMVSVSDDIVINQSTLFDTTTFNSFTEETSPFNFTSQINQVLEVNQSTGQPNETFSGNSTTLTNMVSVSPPTTTETSTPILFVTANPSLFVTANVGKTTSATASSTAQENNTMVLRVTATFSNTLKSTAGSNFLAGAATGVFVVSLICFLHRQIKRSRRVHFYFPDTEI